MIIFNTINEIVVIIEDDQFLFFNTKEKFKKERLFLSVTMLTMAVLNLIFGDSSGNYFWVIIWVLLAVVWIAYFVYHSTMTKFPDRIYFSEISLVKFKIGHKKNTLLISCNNSDIRLIIHNNDWKNSILRNLKEKGIRIEEI